MASDPGQPGLPQEDLAGVIGFACRVPGASNPCELWDVIDKQRDLRSKVPRDRFNVDAFFSPVATTKGRTNAKYGYFMKDSVRAFDAGFFSISRKEAEAMDPQHRLALEVVYEAFEDAGLSLEAVSGTVTSVYCGSSTDDYSGISTSDLTDYPTYANTGTGPCMLANRISYFYNLKGESMLVNTACSSSLVCLHHGSESIKSECCDMAVIVGSSLLLEPRPFITMADFNMLSTDGYCRAFDRAGQGFARGEGVCALILKRVRDAQTDGDTIKAVIRGSYSNHDGSKAGLTVPSPEAQAALIRRAYARAKIETKGTAFVEAHGTGTPVGDPKEAEALTKVFGDDGRAEPIYVGSIKTAVGHLEGAAGIVGAIKAIMCIERGMIPGNMHFSVPREGILVGKGGICFPTRTIPWPDNGGLRRASVNSFGYGGSNAHCIIEEYRPSTPDRPAMRHEMLGERVHLPERSYLIALSSHSKASGMLFAKKLLEYVQQNPQLEVSRLARTLSTRRTLHANRACFVASNLEDVLRELQSLVVEKPWTQGVEPHLRIGFVFTGQGAQWATMGNGLLGQIHIFEETLSKCQNALDSLSSEAPSWSIIEELRRSKETSNMNQAEYSQPICTAVQIGLVEVLRSWGICPSAVVGHSSGEIAAAFAAGHVDLEQAMLVAYYRGLFATSNVFLDGSLPKGGMLAVGMAPYQMKACISEFNGGLDLAAINSLSSVTVSGDLDALHELAEKLKQEGCFNRMLAVDKAYHSHHMRSVGTSYFQALSRCPASRNLPQMTIPMFSSVTARKIQPNQIGPQYWVDNMMAPVRFADALMETIMQDDETTRRVDALLELGPHPALKGPSMQTMEHIGPKVLGAELPYIASLQRGKPDFEALLSTVRELYKQGHPIVFEKILAASQSYFAGSTLLPPRLKNLPSYTWDHEDYWYQSKMTTAAFNPSYRHALLGTPSGVSTDGCCLWRNVLKLEDIPWLQHHQVQNAVVFPASGYITIAVEAVLRVNHSRNYPPDIQIEHVHLLHPLTIPEGNEGVEIVTRLESSAPKEAGNGKDVQYSFSLSSLTGNERISTTHCTGKISMICQRNVQDEALIDMFTPGCLFSMSAAQLYERFAALGIQYGVEFRLIEGDLEFDPSVSKANIRYENNPLSLTPEDDCCVHPAFLDSVLHPILPIVDANVGREAAEPLVPSIFYSIRLSKTFLKKTGNSEVLRVLVKTTLVKHGHIVANIVVQGADKEDLITIRGLELRSLGAVRQALRSKEKFFKLRWQPAFNFLELSPTTNVLTSDIFQAMDVFCHQYPKARILLVPDRALKDLNLLLDAVGGGPTQEHRRFSKITVACPEGSLVLRNGLEQVVEVAMPAERIYDVAVVLSPNQLDLAKLVKERGYVLSSTGVTAGGFMILPVPSSENTDYNMEKSSVGPAAIDLVHFTGQEKMTGTSGGAARAVEKHLDALKIRCHKIDLATIAAGWEPTTDTIVVLSPFQTDLLWNEGIPPPREDFEGSRDDFEKQFTSLKQILLVEDKRMIWVLRGSNAKRSRPQHALVQGMLRTARNENPSSKISAFEISSNAKPLESLCQWLPRVLGGAHEDEIRLYEGALYIPRLVLDSPLNARGYSQLDPIELDPKKSYLLVGGFSGLGCQLLTWLAIRGARHLTVLSRSGATTKRAKDLVHHFQKQGVQIKAIKGDVMSLPTVVSCVRHSRRKLGGIFHMAMVLRDTLLPKLSYEGWYNSVAPKVQGALNLGLATSGIDLDFFICFSSTSAILGPQGQANYAAGNCFLDAFMRQRREEGLVGTTINLGMVEDAGVVAENSTLRIKMRQLGFQSLSFFDMLLQVELAVADGKSKLILDTEGSEAFRTISGANITNNTFAAYEKSIFQCLSSMVDNREIQASPENDTTRSEDFCICDIEEDQARHHKTLSMLIQTISTFTGVPKELVDPSRSAINYGVDSLTASGVRNIIRNAVGVEIGVFEILGGNTINELAAKLTVLTIKGQRTEPLAASTLQPGSSQTDTARGMQVTKDVPILTDAQRHHSHSFSAYQRLWLNKDPTFVSDDRSKVDAEATLDTKGAPSVISQFMILGSLDQGLFLNALLELVQRNEVLRTKFDMSRQLQRVVEANLQDEETRQDLMTWYNLTKPTQDEHELVDLDEFVAEAIKGMRRWNYRSGYKLNLRVTVTRAAPKQFVVTIALNKVISDEWTSVKLMGQLDEIYGCLERKEDLASIPKHSIQHVDFSLWYENHLAGAAATDVDFWINYMAAAVDKPLSLPFADATADAKFPWSFNNHEAMLGAPVVARMKRVAIKLGVQDVDVLQALFAFYLAHNAEPARGEVFIFVEDTKVPASMVRDVLGSFDNILPMKHSGLLAGSFEDVIAASKRERDAVTEHHGIAIGIIVGRLGINNQAVFGRGSATFHYSSAPNHSPAAHQRSTIGSSTFEIEMIATDGPQIWTDLSLAVEVVTSTDLRLKFMHRKDVYHEAGGKAFLDGFVKCLELVLAEPYRSFRDVLGGHLASSPADISTDVPTPEAASSNAVLAPAKAAPTLPVPKITVTPASPVLVNAISVSIAPAAGVAPTAPDGAGNAATTSDVAGTPAEVTEAFLAYSEDSGGNEYLDTEVG